MRTAQTALLTAQGFKPVSNMTDEVKNDIPFAIRKPVFRLSEDGESFTMNVQERCLSVRLSQEKLVAHEAIAGKLPTLMSALQADAELQAWWCNSMNYVRHSSVAQKAMEAFGLTQEEMERIALECKA
ncbi:MAG: hypothetical protein ACI4QT_00435 [Kiritimatiellia bacterium]